jgi:hypothetical protein
VFGQARSNLHTRMFVTKTQKHASKALRHMAENVFIVFCYNWVQQNALRFDSTFSRQIISKEFLL